MTRTPLWKDIAETLSRDIAKGHFQQDNKLPTEAALAERFGVNRHTVRRALSGLVDQGLIYTRRGAGAFVAVKPLTYQMGKRVRFHQSAEALGYKAQKRILSRTTRPADEQESEALGIGGGDDVHVAEGLALIDGQAVAHFISVFAAARFPDLLRYLEETQSVTQSLAACGVADFTRKTTRLTAVNARATTAALLNLKPEAALLRSINVDVDLDGVPVEFGRTWFSGDHIEITLEN